MLTIPFLRSSHGLSDQDRLCTHCRRIRRRVMVALPTIASLLGVLPAEAQSGQTGRLRAPTANACAEVTMGPTMLAAQEAGVAVLRMQRELQSAAEAMARARAEAPGGEVNRRVIALQERLDSIMRQVARGAGASGSNGGAAPGGKETRVLLVRPLPLGSADGPAQPGGQVMELRVMEAIRALQPQITAVFDGVRARPGYLGLTMSGAQVRTVTDAGVLTSHCEYPMVESVEVRSPAARAGLNAGDTIVAYNGRDLRLWAVNYPAMLIPGDTVRIRLRRAGRAAEVPVTVEARSAVEGTRLAPGDSTGFRVIDEFGRPLPVTVVPRPVANALASFAGAEFAAVDDAFLANLGLKPGILVLRVPPGTPAAEAGLRSGEVVRRINDAPVRDPLALRRTFMAANGTVRLVVQGRGEKERVVVLSRR